MTERLVSVGHRQADSQSHQRVSVLHRSISGQVRLYTLWHLYAFVTRAAAVTVLVGSLASAAASWRDAAVRPPDPVASLEAEFRTFARVLPPSGAVGFLKYYEGDGSAEHLLVYYVAQYALAPRLVVKQTDPEFLIVAPGALRPDGDDRLQGFQPIASSKEGYHLYQRRVP